MGKEKATANTVKDSTGKNLAKVTVKVTVNIVSEGVTTPKQERDTATATPTATYTTPEVIKMVSLSQLSIKDCYKLATARKIENIFQSRIACTSPCLSTTYNIPLISTLVSTGLIAH